jgi:hypothetical protein
MFQWPASARLAALAPDVYCLRAQAGM